MRFSRRRYLSVVGMAALAGCSGDANDGAGTSDGTTTDRTQSATGTESTTTEAATTELVAVAAKTLDDLERGTTVELSELSKVDSNGYSPTLSAVTSSHLYVQDTTGEYFGMAAVSRDTGLLDWRRTDLDDRAHVVAYPEHGLVLPNGGTSRVLDASTGEVAWNGLGGSARFSTGSEIWTYGGDYPGRFQAHDVTDGSVTRSVTSTPYDNYGGGDALDAENEFLYEQNVQGVFVLPVPGPSERKRYRYVRTVGVDDETIDNLSGGSTDPSSVQLFPEQSGGFEVSGVTVSGDIVVFAGAKLVTVRRDEIASGSPTVVADTDAEVVTVSGNRVYAKLGDRLVAFDGLAGEERWSVSGIHKVTPFGEYALCTPTSERDADPPVRTVIELASGRELGTIELSFTAAGSQRAHSRHESLLTTEDCVVASDGSVVAVFDWPALADA